MESDATRPEPRPEPVTVEGVALELARLRRAVIVAFAFVVGALVFSFWNHHNEGRTERAETNALLCELRDTAAGLRTIAEGNRRRSIEQREDTDFLVANVRAIARREGIPVEGLPTRADVRRRAGGGESRTGSNGDGRSAPAPPTARPAPSSNPTAPPSQRPRPTKRPTAPPTPTPIVCATAGPVQACVNDPLVRTLYSIEHAGALERACDDSD